MIDPQPTAIQQRLFAATLTFLGLLLIVDLMFILGHALHSWSPWLNARHFSIEDDGGLAEQYQYIKQVWVICCLGIAFLHSRSRVYLGWGLLFCFLLADDRMQLHEHFGDVLARQLEVPAAFGLRPGDFGELLMAGTIGLCVVLFVGLNIWRGSAHGHHLSVDLLCLVVLLGLFGVLVDALHTILFFQDAAAAPAFGLIEDGGEMLVISAIAAYVFDIASNAGQLRISIWSRLRQGKWPGAS